MKGEPQRGFTKMANPYNTKQPLLEAVMALITIVIVITVIVTAVGLAWWLRSRSPLQPSQEAGRAR